MNKKDLFNAIDNIDEKFINDAGKYLKSVSALQDEEPEELEAQKRRFSPLRMIMPIAASLAVIVGVTVAVKTMNSGIEKKPTTTTEDSFDADDPYRPGMFNASASGTAASVSVDAVYPVTETVTALPSGELPFELYGPDYLPLSYDDITSVEFIKGAEDADATQLNAKNWTTINCRNFAYVARPLGIAFINYKNTFDEEYAESYLSGDSDSIRLYAGEKYGDLVVKSASAEFKNVWRSNANDTDNVQYNANLIPQMLNSSYVSFEGQITVNGYIVKSSGDTPIYMFYIGNDERGLPTMSFSGNGDRGFSRTPITESLNGIKYYGELPSVRISSEYEATLGAYFVDANVLPAVVTLSNIGMLYISDSNKRWQLWADTAVDSINGFPFEGNGEYDSTVQAIIDNTTTTAELNEILFELEDEIMTPYNISGFVIYRDVISDGGRHSLEQVIDDVPLEAGMYVYFYDKVGNVYNRYIYTPGAD